MNIYKLFRWQKEHAVSVPKEPDVQIQPEETGPWDPKYVQDITLRKLLNVTGRSRNDMPGEGHNNCGFNSILEQVGDRTRNSEMVNLLRNKLGYGDESSNQMFDSHACLDVVDLFQCPVVEICHSDGRVTQLSFAVPGVSSIFVFTAHEDLSNNFAAWCSNCNWKQKEIDDLSSWLRANFPGFDFGEATLDDVLLQLLQSPTTIALVSVVGGGHFDALPHKDLQSTGNALEFLRGAKGYSRVKILNKEQKPEETSVG